jgi:hypothetical protein
MPLLVYCVLEAAAAVQEPARGVGGTQLEQLQEFGLCCFFSRFETREQLSRIPAVESALAFHQVLQAVLRHATLIPFRFPTLVENEGELRENLQENGPRYAQALGRLRDLVQMEIRISALKENGGASKAISGSDYLRERKARAQTLASAVEQFRQATREWVADWREHQGPEGLRCYALVPRNAVTRFQQAAQALTPSVAGARVSGPWPPAEFLEPVEDR